METQTGHHIMQSLAWCGDPLCIWTPCTAGCIPMNPYLHT